MEYVAPIISAIVAVPYLYVNHVNRVRDEETIVYPLVLHLFKLVKFFHYFSAYWTLLKCYDLFFQQVDALSWLFLSLLFVFASFLVVAAVIANLLVSLLAFQRLFVFSFPGLSEKIAKIGISTSLVIMLTYPLAALMVFLPTYSFSLNVLRNENNSVHTKAFFTCSSTCSTLAHSTFASYLLVTNVPILFYVIMFIKVKNFKKSLTQSYSNPERYIALQIFILLFVNIVNITYNYIGLPRGSLALDYEFMQANSWNPLCYFSMRSYPGHSSGFLAIQVAYLFCNRANVMAMVDWKAIWRKIRRSPAVVPVNEVSETRV